MTVADLQSLPNMGVLSEEHQAEVSKLVHELLLKDVKTCGSSKRWFDKSYIKTDCWRARDIGQAGKFVLGTGCLNLIYPVGEVPTWTAHVDSGAFLHPWPTNLVFRGTMVERMIDGYPKYISIDMVPPTALITLVPYYQDSKILRGIFSMHVSNHSTIRTRNVTLVFGVKDELIWVKWVLPGDYAFPTYKVLPGYKMRKKPYYITAYEAKQLGLQVLELVTAY